MRILVLGAGALGGYFGGRLLEAGADVAFLVRPRRRAQLERDGLVIESPIRRPAPSAPLLSPGEAAPGWDVVLLACKAYDLEDAIAAIRPAVDARTAVLPVLNGISHIETLRRASARSACWAASPRSRRPGAGRHRAAPERLALSHLRRGGRAHEPARPRPWRKRRPARKGMVAAAVPTSPSACGRSWSTSAPAPFPPC
jgi:2-dehydropantoate 2-reductase